MIAIIKHYAFPDFLLELPIDWRVDPYKNKNWLHHFNSLRWVKNVKDLDVRKKILVSFYKFHCERKIHNPYYSSLRGDHTASIRLTIVFDLREAFKKEGVVSGYGICNRLINAELVNLQNPSMYRTGHNHGLMVDLSILNLIRRDSSFDKKVNIEKILKRSGVTLDCLWHDSGQTKEHSISYQEFNLPLVKQYFYLLDELNLNARTKIDFESLKYETQKILGYALKNSGEYFPLGDSFRKPNEKLLSNIYKGLSTGAKNILRPFSLEKGELKKEGFYIKRFECDGKLIHFAATCGWDSFSHKQNDEFHFCLDVNGYTFFDDPGYSTACDKDTTAFLKSEDAHTTFTIMGSQWSDRKKTNGKSKIEYRTENHKDTDTGISMSHERIDGVVSSRKVAFNDSHIIITDSLENNYENKFSKDEVVEIRHRFVLSPEVKADICKESMCCRLNVGDITCFLYYTSGSASLSEIPYVGKDKKEIIKTLVIDVKSFVKISCFSTVNVFNIEVFHDC